MTADNKPEHTCYLTVRQFAEKHPWPTQSRLRSLILHKDTNGLAPAIKKIGKSVLIDEHAFFNWVSAQNIDNKEQR